MDKHRAVASMRQTEALISVIFCEGERKTLAENKLTNR